MQIKCRAFFEANNQDEFGFYGANGEAHRRIRHGEEFMYEWDEDNPPEIIDKPVIVSDGLDPKGRPLNPRHETKKMIGTWIEVLQMPKKKPGPKPKVDKADGNNKLLDTA